MASEATLTFSLAVSPPVEIQGSNALQVGGY
jgi:hypothetical protein